MVFCHVKKISYEPLPCLKTQKSTFLYVHCNDTKRLHVSFRSSGMTQKFFNHLYAFLN